MLGGIFDMCASGSSLARQPSHFPFTHEPSGLVCRCRRGCSFSGGHDSLTSSVPGTTTYPFLLGDIPRGFFLSSLSALLWPIYMPYIPLVFPFAVLWKSPPYSPKMQPLLRPLSPLQLQNFKIYNLEICVFVLPYPLPN